MDFDAFTLGVARINFLPATVVTRYHYATQPKSAYLSYTPVQNLKMERRTIARRKKENTEQLLTSPLANVSLGGGSLIQQHHPHGDCSIWDKVVKETTHLHTGEEKAGGTHCPGKNCWTHICTHRCACIEQICENSRYMYCTGIAWSIFYRMWPLLQTIVKYNVIHYNSPRINRD